MKCENTHVLIIGGGYGGLLLAHKIKSNHVCKVTLVDPKDSMVHYVAALRSSVIPGVLKMYLYILYILTCLFYVKIHK